MTREECGRDGETSSWVQVVTEERDERKRRRDLNRVEGIERSHIKSSRKGRQDKQGQDREGKVGMVQVVVSRQWREGGRVGGWVGRGRGVEAIGKLNFTDATEIGE